jgi:secreted trypsin-like serine protease
VTGAARLVATSLLLTFVSYAAFAFPPSRSQAGQDDRQARAAQPSRAAQSDGSKIVGGEDADATLYPWIVAIGELNEETKKVAAYCAGTLVSPSWILTAAHCRVVKGDYVVVGRSDLSKIDVGKQVRIATVVPHPEYCPKNLDHDLALLQLADPQTAPWLKVTDEAESAIDTATRLSIAGWGQLGELDYQLPDKLQQALVKLYSQEACVGDYAGIGREVTGFMYCAQGKAVSGAGVSDACKGDSGGPIAAFDDPRHSATLVGIISKGEGCARRGFPGVYTKISKLLPWISQCQADPTAAVCRKRYQPAC